SATEINHPAVCDYAFEQLPFLGTLADNVRLPLFWMDVHIRPGDIHVAAEYQVDLSGTAFRRVALHRFQETHFGGKILAAVGDIDGGDYQAADAGSDDAGFAVEV